MNILLKTLFCLSSKTHTFIIRMYIITKKLIKLKNRAPVCYSNVTRILLITCKYNVFRLQLKSQSFTFSIIEFGLLELPPSLLVDRERATGDILSSV